MKHSYYFLITLIMSALGHGQLSENFDAGLANNGFQTGSYALSSGTWDAVSVRENKTQIKRDLVQVRQNYIATECPTQV